MSIVVWKGNKYVWSDVSGCWFGYYGVRGEDYPGDNMMVPVGLWGHLYLAASQQGIKINRSASKGGSDSESDDDTDVTVKKVKKSGASKGTGKKFGKSISIFGE